MAKPERKERKLISTLTNLEKVDKNYNQPIEEEKTNIEEKSYNIQIRTHQDWIDKFRQLHINFLSNTEKYEEYRYLMSFFTMVLKEFIDDFKKSKEFYKADNKFLEYISRKGQRKKGSKSLNNDPDKMRVLVIGTYKDNDETKEMWKDVIYCIAKKENMENMLEYSASYFFIDVIDYIEKNKERLIEKYK